MRAAVVRDGRSAVLEVEINPGSANRARVNRSQLPRARELRRPGAHGDLLARGPGAGQGRPVRAAPVPRRPAGAAHAAAGRRPRRLRPDAQAAQLPAQDRRPARRARVAGRGAVHARTSGTTTWPAPAPSCWPRGSRWSTSCGPTSARPTRPWPAGRSRDDAGMDYRPSLRRSATATTSTGRADRALLAELERRGRRARPGHLAGRPAPRRAAARPSATASARLPVRATPRHGESWSFALALRLASYDLLRADGDDPILILDDVFAELDTERRDQLGRAGRRRRAGARDRGGRRRRARGAGRGALRRRATGR